jgi:hypothetical protein
MVLSKDKHLESRENVFLKERLGEVISKNIKTVN